MDERVVIERADKFGDRVGETIRRYEPGLSRAVWAIGAGWLFGELTPPWVGIFIAVAALGVSALVFWAEHYQPKE